MNNLWLRTRTAFALSLLLFAGAAYGQDVKVMISGGFTAAYLEVVPEFERATGNKIVTSFGASMGSAPDSIPVRLQRGEPADVVILAGLALDDLIAQGRVLAGSRVDLARSSIGMVVRTGARRPDISSVEALKRTLLQARSIALSSRSTAAQASPRRAGSPVAITPVVPSARKVRVMCRRRRRRGLPVSAPGAKRERPAQPPSAPVRVAALPRGVALRTRALA